MSKTIAVGMALALIVVGVARAEEPGPAAVAAERAAKLGTNLKTFRLELNYNGEQGKPFYNLLLSVPPPGADRASPFHLKVQITERQAEAIVRHLAVEGFLGRAQEGPFKRTPPLPYYSLSVRVEGGGSPVLYGEILGMNIGMLHRLDGLRKVLAGDAAQALDLLLARMEGHRRIWQRHPNLEGVMPDGPPPGVDERGGGLPARR